MKNAELYVNTGFSLLLGTLGTVSGSATKAPTTKPNSVWNEQETTETPIETQQPAAQEKTAEEEFTPFDENSKYKDKDTINVLKSVFPNYNNYDKSYQTRFATKYNTMVDIAKQNKQKLSDEIIETRLKNYAKGLDYHTFELCASQEKAQEYKNSRVGNTSIANLKQQYILKGMEETQAEEKAKEEMLNHIKTSYLQFGKEYVETYDIDGNGKVDVNEMFYRKLIDYYQAQDMKPDEIISKAEEMANKAKAGTLEEGSEEENLYYGVVSRIINLDNDNDDSLSTKEASAYLMSMALLNDDKHSITSEELIMADEMLESFDVSANIFNSDNNKIRLRGNQTLTEDEIEENLQAFAKDNDIPVEILKQIKQNKLSDNDIKNYIDILMKEKNMSEEDATTKILSVITARKFTENLNAYQEFFAK